MQHTTEGFLAGIILFNADRATIPLDQPKEAELKPTANAQVEKKIKETVSQHVVKLNEPTLIGKKGEKKYKLTLELYNEKVLLLKVVDISHGVGHVLIQRSLFDRKERNEITISIQRT